MMDTCSAAPTAPLPTSLRPLPLLRKLFERALPLLDDPFVVHPRSIFGQSPQIKTGYGEELR